MPHHAAAAALPGTLLVATLPAGFAIEHAAPGTTTLVTAPQQIGAMSYTMSWHPRLDDDTGQRWLREAIVATLSTTRSQPTHAAGHQRGAAGTSVPATPPDATLTITDIAPRPDTLRT